MFFLTDEYSTGISSPYGQSWCQQSLNLIVMDLRVQGVAFQDPLSWKSTVLHFSFQQIEELGVKSTKTKMNIIKKIITDMHSFINIQQKLLFKGHYYSFILSMHFKK